MATEILRPDGEGASWNVAGSGSNWEDAADDSDATRLTLSAGFQQEEAHLTYPTPTGNPDSTQTFYARAQRSSGTFDLRMEVWESNSLNTALSTQTLTGSIATYSDTWNASILNTADGSAVEGYYYPTSGSFGSIRVYDVWWDCQYTAGGSSVNVTPGSATVTVTGYAPTAANNTSVDVSPGAATVTATGFAPTVDIPFSVTPDAAAITVSGFAPTAENNLSVNVTPDAAALTITGFAPTAADNLSVDVTPDAASLTVTGFAPTVTAGQSVNVTPDAASITVTGFAPTVADNLSVDVTPDAASIILAGFAPTVTAVSDQPAAAPTPKGPGPGGGFLPDTMRAIERGIKKTGKRRKKDRDALRSLLRQAIEGAQAEGVDLEPVREIAEEVAPVRRALPNVAITLDFTRVERALEAVSAAIRADLEAQEARRLSEWAQNEEDAVVALLMTM